MLREDLWQMIMGMTRLPHMLGLDLKVMIAANNVAIVQLRAPDERYGSSVVETIMQEEIASSERRIRKVLSELPDGVFRGEIISNTMDTRTSFIRFGATATKRGDSLTLDMTGTSPQAPGFINCTASGMRGAALAALLPILAPDIRWNEGIMHAVDLIAPKGVLCTRLGVADFGWNHLDRMDRSECRRAGCI